MTELGRILIGLGIVIVIVGAVLMLGGKFGLHRLPGDIVIRRGNTTFFFPIVSCILGSILLTLIFNLLFRRR